MENKTGKYLKYAIGEIVLVVIGILIALQINNWNENQKKIKYEAELLISLEKEITDIIAQLEQLKIKNEYYKQANNGVKAKIEFGIDSISLKDVSEAFNYSSSIVDSPILDDIITSNSNVLVKRKELITDLRILKNSYKSVAKVELYLDEFWNSKVTDFFYSCGISFEAHKENEEFISINDIKLGGYTKKQFIALIKIKYDLQGYWENRKEIAYKKSQAVLEILKNKL